MLILPKPFDFPDKNPSSHPTAKEMRGPRSTHDGKHSLVLHEQLAHLQTENTQMKLQT